jgi:predicted XRE-type DNA-binding protein
MTPEEKKLYTLMAVAEEQQNAIHQAIQKLNLTQEQIQSVIAKQTQASVSNAVNEGLKEGTDKLIGTAKQLNQLNQSIQKNINQLSWKFIALCASGIFSIVMALVVVFMMIVPSLDEIQQRRADLKQLKEYSIQVRKTSDGKPVVRVMSKKPCYAFGDSKVYDWCLIDPKK